MRKFLSNFFIATSVVLLSNSVFGASFDCGLPSLNATEQFICKNPVISDLDERMAIIYAENYKKLSQNYAGDYSRYRGFIHELNLKLWKLERRIQYCERVIKSTAKTIQSDN